MRTIKNTPVERIDYLEKNEFLHNYKLANKPVVIEKLTEDWPARKKWNVDYITKVAGDCVVPLYDSKPSKDNKHQHAPAIEMKLKDYFQMLEQGENDLRLFFYNILSGVPELVKDFSYPEMGLHFFKKLPVLFAGGKGAKVQMHFDIDLADIFLCHFGGKKRVLLISPEQTQYMYRVPFSFSSLFDVDFDNPDYEKYPALRYLQGEVAELNHGDVLYIPPGYWHYIVYEDIGFSMSLRAFPRTTKNFLKMLNNLFVIRVIEGLMRKIIGQPWNDRNEGLALIRTNKRI
ncbi:MAG: cupin-like domain-containing protein [Gammaproteobacteria bacterium]|nr:cupin-like domain-containing protein [Gammaproteobacteria bacterium]MDH5660839.1 cupin-like domain-containing protein [Gammaproteobacteria bacterium]